jgi:hypothetical protein
MLFIADIGFLACSRSVQAQAAVDSDTAQTGVFLVKLHDPVYPQIARTAGVHGDIHLTIRVRKDGTTQAVDVVSGPPTDRVGERSTIAVRMPGMHRGGDRVLAGLLISVFT